jgi:glycosyltransferase involved in cell wall biosynthesis
MSRSTVSILIAAYEAGHYISGALDGVERQVFTDWEVIVVEDGSKDDTEYHLRAFAAKNPGLRIVYDNLGVNRGVSAARNRLLELARGEIVAFLDADDHWEAEHLRSLIECVRAGHSVACTPITRWDGENDFSHGEYAPLSDQLARPCLSLIKDSFIQTSSCVALPRKTIERVGNFDESLRIGEDRDYWFRALEFGGSLGCTENATCRYTKHKASSMAKTLLVAEDTVKFYEKHQRSKIVPLFLLRRKLAEALRTLGRLSRRDNAEYARNTFSGGICRCAR